MYRAEQTVQIPWFLSGTRKHTLPSCAVSASRLCDKHYVTTAMHAVRLQLPWSSPYSQSISLSVGQGALTVKRAQGYTWVSTSTSSSTTVQVCLQGFFGSLIWIIHPRRYKWRWYCGVCEGNGSEKLRLNSLDSAVGTWATCLRLGEFG